MSHQAKYKIIAAFLLFVFSMNTIAGFACSLGIDMGYNAQHHSHEKQELAKTHSHSDAGISLANISPAQEDCCSGPVNSFAQLDKSVPYNDLHVKPPVFSILSICHFLITGKAEPELDGSSKFGFIQRWRPLDDTDIRIAIQSFQI